MPTIGPHTFGINETIDGNVRSFVTAAFQSTEGD